MKWLVETVSLGKEVSVLSRSKPINYWLTDITCAKLFNCAVTDFWLWSGVFFVIEKFSPPAHMWACVCVWKEKSLSFCKWAIEWAASKISLIVLDRQNRHQEQQGQQHTIIPHLLHIQIMHRYIWEYCISLFRMLKNPHKKSTTIMINDQATVRPTTNDTLKWMCGYFCASGFAMKLK